MTKKFLVIRFSSIGDIVLTTPVIRALHEQLGAEVHFLTKKAFAPILLSNPHLTRVIALTDDFDSMMDELKSEEYDHIIDLHHNLRTKRIKLALGIPSSSFYKLNFEKWMLVRFGINRLPETHIVDRYLATAKHLGVKKDEGGLDFYIPSEKKVDLFDLFGFSPESYVSIVIGAAHQTKCLTTRQISELCNLIQKPVILLGGKGEIEKAELILKATSSKEVKSACGIFDIQQSASILEQSAGIITHDTGLMHIAAALRKPQVVIWGNTIPQFGMYPYYGSNDVKWISFEQTELKCRPCSKLGFASCPKGHFKCIMNHNLSQITDAVNSLWMFNENSLA